MVRDGIFFSFPFLALAAGCFYLYDNTLSIWAIYSGLAFFFIAAFMAFFFRDPEREIPTDENAILSPADGKIIDLSEHDDNKKISVFLSVLDVHVNRIPVSGKVTRIDYKKGKFLPAFQSQAADENERCEIEIQSRFGPIVVRQIAGILARRVVCRLKVGQIVQAGERFGLIRFGSRVDLILPASTKPIVAMGNRVKAGATIIGRFE